MPHLGVADRVKETTTTTGTGTIDLAGAVEGYQTFVAGIGNGHETYYSISNRDADEWEVGYGTITDAATDTLSRSVVISSSNGGSLVNFSAGTKDVICTLPADRSFVIDDEANVSVTANVTATSFDGSGAALTSLNASNVSSGTLPNARLDAQLQDIAGLATTSGKIIQGDGANFVLSSYTIPTSDGTTGQVLTTNGSGVVTFQTPTVGDITAVTAGSGLTGGGTTGDVTLNVGAGTGVTVNADDIAIGQDVATSASPTFAGGTFTANVALGDLDHILMGPTGEYQIYHDHANGVSVIKDVDAGGSINIDADTISLTGGNVGIGTSSPGTALDVSGTVTADGLTVDGNATIGTDTAGLFSIKGGSSTSSQIRFLDGGTGRARIGVPTGSTYLSLSGSDTLTADVVVNSSGNVGIGTTSPASLLELEGTSTTAKIHIQSTSLGATSFDGSGAGLLLTASGMNTTNKFTPAIQFGSTDSAFTTTNPKVGAAINAEARQTYGSDDTGGMALAFYTTPNSPGTGQTTTQRLRIENNGDISFYEDTGTTAKLFWDASAESLGIGTSSPTQKLDIDTGNLNFSNAYGIEWGTNNSVRGSASTNLINFRTAGSERMRIDSSGNVGIGTTVPTSLLDINSSGPSTTPVRIDASTGSGSVVWVESSGSDFYQQIRDTSGTTKVQLNSNGNSYFTGGSIGIGTTSPQRLLHVQAASGDAFIRVETDGTDAGDHAVLELLTTSTSASSYIYFGDSLDTNAGMIRYGHSADFMAFTVNTSEALRIDSNGQISISGSTASFDTTGALNGVQLYYETDSGLATIGSYSSGGTTSLAFHTNESGSASTEKMRLTSTGLGIGTSSPSQTLDVAGTILTDKAYIALATLTDGATINWDMADESVAKVTLGGNRTIAAPTNGSTGQFASITVIQDGTGSRTLTWNAVYEFKDDTAPTLTTTGGKGDLFVFQYNGTKWLEVGRNLNLTQS